MGTCKKFVKKGCTLVAALAALALIPGMQISTFGQGPQAHGVTVHKVCTTPRDVGQTVDCTITVTNDDGFGDNIQINSGFDTECNTAISPGCAGTRTPASGSLPVSSVGGNTNCGTGAFSTCDVGPSCGPGGVVATCIDGSTATFKDFGFLNFHNDSYTLLSTDATLAFSMGTLNDLGASNVQDLCNAAASGGGTPPGSDGCSNIAVSPSFPAATAVLSCSVHIDKQISCDGGVTWADADTTTGNQVTGPCTGFSGDPIQVRFVVKNTGTDQVNSCTIHDVTGDTPSSSGGTEYTADFTTGLTTLTAGQTVTTGAITTAPDGVTGLTCAPAGPNDDTAKVDCTCKTSAADVNANDTATFSCETCGVQIDKQVSCAGGAFVDVFGTDDSVNGTGTAGTVIDTCIGLDAFTGHTADNIEVQYVITNTGTDGVNTCTYGETNAAITGQVTIPGAPGTIASGAGATTLPFTNPCSPALIANEVSGQDTATMSCTCNSLQNNTTVKTVGFMDTAGFTCEAPGLTVMKTCAPQDSDTPPDNDVTITATNTSTTVGLFNCVATDTYATGGACPNGTPPFANSLTVNPSGTPPINLGVSGSGTETATWTGALAGLTTSACNDGSVQCNVGSTTGPAITANFQATCPVGKGCETRTPGYWAQHSAVTKAVIAAQPGGVLENCGLMINDSDGGDCSAFEDLCSIGRDANTLGISPVQQNLIFQCMAAELNVAVTLLDNGDCGTTIPNSNLTFDNCCGAEGACAEGATVNLATVAACQSAVGAFNGQFENCPDPTNPLCTPSTSFLNGSANPADCQAAKNDGLVNDMAATGANLGTEQADCSGERLYIPKSTGKKK